MKNNICYLDLRGVYSGEGTSTQAAVYEAMYVLATSIMCHRIPFGLSHNQYATGRKRGEFSMETVNSFEQT